jgi:hypothetical protein
MRFSLMCSAYLPLAEGADSILTLLFSWCPPAPDTDL